MKAHAQRSRSWWFAILFAVALPLAAGAAYVTPPETTLKIKEGIFTVIVSQDLAQANPAIETALIVIHGSERNANTYYDSMAFASMTLHKEKSTLIISPHFKEPGDALQSREFTWNSEGWLSGDAALSDRISSFDVMDTLVGLISNPALFPNLKTIVITGHSAGGQFTQRYAVGNRVEDLIPRIKMRYIVSNPGSYVYLTPKRPVAGAVGTFAVPAAAHCRSYDEYKYGLKGLNEYMSRAPVKTMIEKYIHRDVTYLLGELDINGGDIDQDCPARLQGDNRLNRGRNFEASLDAQFPTHTHKLQTVPAIGHTERGIYMSPVGLKTLFP